MYLYTYTYIYIHAYIYTYIQIYTYMCVVCIHFPHKHFCAFHSHHSTVNCVLSICFVFIVD